MRATGKRPLATLEQPSKAAGAAPQPETPSNHNHLGHADGGCSLGDDIESQSSIRVEARRRHEYDVAGDAARTDATNHHQQVEDNPLEGV